ncbi:FAS1-like dehydratase domain-containing protein [Pseudoroseomonas ludipueritiae]|uniref:MaoC family dehydratase N-terminal domain-containing protein n=1 Tax=Pseudoroseomonas ludipueritiae TaxID=198093 RepID=A0ABR7R2C6_9PROT|nr:MaoC family dehydratase N-terminal domain-containing protein [Pseudoroseomonas ludipueritiae]MBC9175899.1 MaoC family dehydratase N-terminal domain-containing protein [Pseudoroseomonas ludipueritiae]
MSAANDIAAALPELESWIGRSRLVPEEITLPSVRRAAATFDLDPDSFKAGDELPPHWYSLFFADMPRQSVIGHDGHPKKGAFLPPIPLPRRMGAGRRVSFMGNLRVGDDATKKVEVAGITPKTGRTGQIVVLTMRHTIMARGQTLAVDEFDAIYREAVTPGASSKTSPPVAAPGGSTWSDTVFLDPVLVFRYGAITWNAHRIHYDADYARGEEGYPAVVQNGGLTMHLLLDAAIRRAPGRLLGYAARLARPLFVGDSVTFHGAAPEGGRMQVWAADKDGLLAAEMTLEFEA